MQHLIKKIPCQNFNNHKTLLLALTHAIVQQVIKNMLYIYVVHEYQQCNVHLLGHTYNYLIVLSYISGMQYMLFILLLYCVAKKTSLA